MTNQEIINQIKYIIAADSSPLMKGAAIPHIKALLNFLENDKDEPALGDDIILEHVDDILESEFSQIIEKQNSMESLKEFDSMRKRIYTKIKDKITGRTTPVVPVIQCHAIIKFWLANNNIRKDALIERAFAGTENETNIAHYKEMFHESNFDLFRFFEALSEPQMCLIIQYIMKNYSGVKMQDIEKHVQ